MTSLRFSVPGAPVPWSRPRPAFKRPGVYITSPKDRAHREAVSVCATAAGAGRHVLDGALVFKGAFLFVPPASWSAKKRAAAIAGEVKHTTRPDLSNLVKLVEDALQPWAIANDAAIVRIDATKAYGEEAKSFVCLEELP